MHETENTEGKGGEYAHQDERGEETRAQEDTRRTHLLPEGEIAFAHLHERFRDAGEGGKDHHHPEYGRILQRVHAR